MVKRRLRLSAAAVGRAHQRGSLSELPDARGDAARATGRGAAMGYGVLDGRSALFWLAMPFGGTLPGTRRTSHGYVRPSRTLSRWASGTMWPSPTCSPRPPERLDRLHSRSGSGSSNCAHNATRTAASTPTLASPLVHRGSAGAFGAHPEVLLRWGSRRDRPMQGKRFGCPRMWTGLRRRPLARRRRRPATGYGRTNTS